MAVLTSGGDAPGMNAAIVSAVQVAASAGAEVVGVEGGYEGLINGKFRPLVQTDPHSGGLAPIPELPRVGGQGGTMLGTGRSTRFFDPEHRRHAARVMRDSGVEALLVIGGNGSMEGAHALWSEHGLAVVGIPASIDNDIGHSRESVGVDTALNTILDACDRISDTARSHHRAFIVEVMGRDCGYLALAGAVATGADAVLLPEKNPERTEVVKRLERLVRHSFSGRRQKRRVLVLKAEGVKIPTEALVAELSEAVADLQHVEVRATVLGHIVRGGNPTFRDRMLASRFGLVAVQAILAGRSGVMVCWSTSDRGEPTSDAFVKLFPLDSVLQETQLLTEGTSDLQNERIHRLEAIHGAMAF
ncbi:MAG: 6-phosphofructokinase [bacterium]|nr:6-phosphofructokinase [bacterium]